MWLWGAVVISARITQGGGRNREANSGGPCASWRFAITVQRCVCGTTSVAPTFLTYVPPQDLQFSCGFCQGVFMGVGHPKREELDRLSFKTLDAQFAAVICDGLNCSRFEANAVLNVVKEVYAPLFAQAPAAQLPGRITLVAVDADEPAGKAVADCEKRSIHLSVHRGADDDRCLAEKGPEQFRQSRIADL